ncbi:MAG: hypothetical protein KJ850_07240 [Gammaproteobacteria bacterium]|nr:hypothetical protein [Gammaproteobacteria bacterium]MBU1624828.1 hypothetical protein [Gammaproteobacteria bacterium]MBU1982672.1 hypothetical protein [Gammaproteobacteria bacterium]
MTDKSQLPAISLQVTELVLAGSPEHAEEAINETAEKFGDLAVVEVLNALEAHVASLHLSSFDGGKLSLATMLISPKAWAESLAYFAATWDEDWIEDEPEVLTESLFAHVHGIVYATDDEERRAELLNAALATDWGATAFAVLFSTAIDEIIEIANDIQNLGAPRSGSTSSDHDVIPMALEIYRTDAEAWERILFEIFPDWRPGENELHPSPDEESDEDPEEDEEARESQFAMGRSTKELLLRLRAQVPSKAPAATKPGARPSLGEDIFS